MTAVYCIFCRTTVDRVIVDHDLSQWAMCPSCHAKAAGDIDRAETLFSEGGKP